MKDIDFDELDKAVSGVLGTNKPTEPVKEAVKTDEEMVLVTPRQTIVTEAATTDAPIPSPAPAVAASPAVRRGRFMDVVHPSSDMTSGTPSPQQSSPAVVAPSARKLAPLSTDIVPEAVPAPEVAPIEPSDDEPKLDTIDALTALDEEKKEDVPPPAPLAEAVAPVDVAPSASADNDETAPEESVVKSPEPVEEEDQPAPAPKTDDEFSDLTVDKVTEPSDVTPTPFLTDTKVDKRPLGAFVAEEAGATTEPLPQELNTEVLKVESKEATDSTAPSSQDVLSSPENSADDSEIKHVFDSESYAAPLVTHKRSSGVWLWVILILVLLAVGSGLGYLWFVNGY